MVGLSILSGAHMTLVPKIVDGLRDNGAEDVLVVVGGIFVIVQCIFQKPASRVAS